LNRVIFMVLIKLYPVRQLAIGNFSSRRPDLVDL